MRPSATLGSTGRSLRLPRYLWVTAATLALAGAAVLYALLGGETEAERQYETVAVSRGPLTARVTATGTLSPRVTVQVGSQVSGRVQALHADFNTPVRKGQLIAKIEPREFEANLASARANLSVAAAAVQRADAQFQVARQTHERTAQLAQRELVSQAQIDEDHAAYQTAQSQLVSAKAALGQVRSGVEQAEVQLAYTNIVSPIDGIVISREVDVGQIVAASFQAPRLFTIAEDLHKMELHTHVAEADVGQLSPGLEVSFGVDAFSTETFRGVVKEVRYSPQNVQNVVTYDAVVSVDNPDLRLRPGMTANVSFRIDERPSALRVPTAALRFRPPDSSAGDAVPADRGSEVQSVLDGPIVGSARRRTVWVLGPDDAPHPIEVRTGISDGRFTEIVSGDLAEGQAVIVARIGEPASGRSQRPGERGSGGGGGRGGSGNRRYMGFP